MLLRQPFLETQANSAVSAGWDCNRRQSQRQRPKTAGAAASRASGQPTGRKLDKKELQPRLERVVDLIRLADDFAPFDKPGYNIALEIWKAVEAVPQVHRHRLLGRLRRGDILDLWRLAGRRYGASQSQVQTAIRPSYHAPDEFPDQPGQVVRFRGKAAVTLPWLNRFQKAFFCPHGAQGLHGRVLLGAGPLGNALFPLYYKATLGSTIIQATQELADLRLDYLPPNQLGLGAQQLPTDVSWPLPKEHRAPFDQGLVDYCRAVGPDVWVGVGWKLDARPPGERFLHFLLVRDVQDADEMVYDRPKGPRGWA